MISSVIIPVMMTLLLFSACLPAHQETVDRLNSRSYAFHYKNLDSTAVLARRAYSLSEGYSTGRAEALNNLAFVDIMRMKYSHAEELLHEVRKTTNNEIEQLIADIQSMRLCQRQSRNKDFYTYREHACQLLARIDEERNDLDDRSRRRMIYARSEYGIVSSTYFYYIGQPLQVAQALADIDPEEVKQDTAQYLDYLYNIGAGGFITRNTQEQTAQDEFNYLMECYLLAVSSDQSFWVANSLQAISEHLMAPHTGKMLFNNNLPAFNYLNTGNMPDSLLAGNLAQRSLELFTTYGDVYQIAGAYRTLAQCYRGIGDNRSAGICLEDALADKAINQAPDLVASIREQLSIVYSAMDNKPMSDYNRNIYLDLQERTRQDRLLEARAAQLGQSVVQLNWMIAAVIAAIILVSTFLIVLGRMRHHADRRYSAAQLLEPLQQWQQERERHVEEYEDRREELQEDQEVLRRRVMLGKERHLEQRAKIELVNSIIPLIERIIHEVDRLQQGEEREEVRHQRFEYISELTDEINADNAVLTRWIQLRQGQLSLHIESFSIQGLFDIVAKGAFSFRQKGISLEIDPSKAVVKADRTLTLFMLNTLADNARKFTSQGGHVHISAREDGNMVVLSVADDGCGMTEDQVSHLFDHKPIVDDPLSQHHGFGLLNCKGIIEKYKKISPFFSGCVIQASSEKGRGTEISFRLPKGVIRTLTMLLFVFLSFMPKAWGDKTAFRQRNIPRSVPAVVRKAAAYADSAYFCNIRGTYGRTLAFADSARHELNLWYRKQRPQSTDTLVAFGHEVVPAEIRWYRDRLKADYSIILDIRNESAVAALALHRWTLYEYNNKIYTSLFRACSADNSLDSYVKVMQKTENSKTVSIVLLILLLFSIFPIFYFAYYRHQLFYRFCLERVRTINGILMDEKMSDEERLRKIRKIWDSRNHIHVGGRRAQKTIDRLDAVVREITASLEKGIADDKNREQELQLAQDERLRLQYENGRLHISNAILDNCLSALKHETMYYPSRIRQLIDEEGETSVEDLRQLVDYYIQLYSLLSAQAMREVNSYVRYDPSMLTYLFTLLKQMGGGESEVVENPHQQSNYVHVRVPFPKMSLTEEQCNNLFTPRTVDLRFLLCRQIVREVGEVTNLRGCGISARVGGQGGMNIELILAKQIWKNLK
ncbi:DUF5112 domain-containing protein [Prevotella sp. AGR2160]|uniref:sensor histidine kinase n=1 Tax=Prevotella sp. AGR2160 TaxID=1280674 RepID=UPI0004143C9A|nr:DUF5112 domain-containing protein [Prevotella sp. AGR2160]